MFVHNSGKPLFYNSNKLFSFFLSELVVNSFFIELSFAFLNDIFFVSASRANIFVSVINNDINVFVFFAKSSVPFSLGWTNFVIFSFPLNVVDSHVKTKRVDVFVFLHAIPQTFDSKRFVSNKSSGSFFHKEKPFVVYYSSGVLKIGKKCFSIVTIEF